jgi:hypothetical protein
MMKKALAYAMTAVFLGVATMLAPLVLIESGSIRFLGSGDGEKALVPCSRAETLDAENTFSEGDSLGRAISPLNLSSAGLMLVPSFLVALGAFLYLKKRMF